MIKFRVWDKVQNKMLLPDNIEFINGQAYWAEASIGDNGSYSNDGKADGIDALFELEQFTGLKDVNGKDIYEGDIVENERGEILRVSYSAIDASFVAGNCYFGSIGAGKEIRIIGNVHASPELLEEDE